MIVNSEMNIFIVFSKFSHLLIRDKLRDSVLMRLFVVFFSVEMYCHIVHERYF